MSHKAKWEYFKAIYERYRKAARRRGCKSRGEATKQDSRYGAPIIRERFIKKFGGIATIKELPTTSCSIRLIRIFSTTVRVKDSSSG